MSSWLDLSFSWRRWSRQAGTRRSRTHSQASCGRSRGFRSWRANFTCSKWTWINVNMVPRRFLVSHSLFKRWQRRCRGDHPHVPLQGFVRDARGRKVFAAKLAQVYPDRLCQVVASSVGRVVRGELPQFKASFALTDASSSRKRPLGARRTWLQHRQYQAAQLAAASGQLKRGALKPLLQIECDQAKPSNGHCRSHTLSLYHLSSAREYKTTFGGSCKLHVSLFRLVNDCLLFGGNVLSNSYLSPIESCSPSAIPTCGAFCAAFLMMLLLSWVAAL